MQVKKKKRELPYFFLLSWGFKKSDLATSSSYTIHSIESNVLRLPDVGNGQFPHKKRIFLFSAHVMNFDSTSCQYLIAGFLSGVIVFFLHNTYLTDRPGNPASRSRKRVEGGKSRNDIAFAGWTAEHLLL